MHARHAGRQQRQLAHQRAGGDHQRVVGQRAAGGDDLARGAVDRGAAGVELDRDAVRGEPAGPGDRRVLGLGLAEQHGLRQRRLLVGLAGLVGDQRDVGRAVLLLGLDGGEHRRRPAADHHNVPRHAAALTYFARTIPLSGHALQSCGTPVHGAEQYRADAPPAISRRTEKGRLSSVATSVRLLKAFSEEQVEIGISDLAKRLGVAKSTVHRLAVTLVADGMLEQNPDTGKYRLGIALFRLGSLVRRRMTMSNEARPLLRELREKVNETVHLAVLDGSEIMYVFNLESTQAIRMRSDVGVRKPAYCTAEGQAILAFQPAEVVERVVRDGLAAAHAADHHRSVGAAEGARRRAAARLRHRGRGERARHALHRGAAAQRRRRGGGGDRTGGAGEPAVEEGARHLHPARHRDRRGDLGAARPSRADRRFVIAALHRSVLARWSRNGPWRARRRAPSADADANCVQPA